MSYCGKSTHKKSMPTHQKPVKTDNLSTKRDKVFKTIPVDVNGKIKIKIDERTTVYAKPGTDVEKLKLKYQNRFKRL